MSKEKQAIALVYKWSALYSGGGREYNYADFIMLSNDGKYSVAFKNILFSSKEQVRACFTERDYSKKSHCYDESGSVLNIKFIDDNKEYYSWGFINKSYDWPSFTDKSGTKMKITQDIKYPFQGGEE